MIPYTQSNVQITAVVKSTLKKCDNNNNNIHYNRNKKNKKDFHTLVPVEGCKFTFIFLLSCHAKLFHYTPCWF